MEEVSGSGYSRSGRDISWGDANWIMHWPPTLAEDPEPEGEPDDVLAAFRIKRHGDRQMSLAAGKITVTLANGSQFTATTDGITLTVA